MFRTLRKLGLTLFGPSPRLLRRGLRNADTGLARSILKSARHRQRTRYPAALARMGLLGVADQLRKGDWRNAKHDLKQFQALLADSESRWRDSYSALATGAAIARLMDADEITRAFDLYGAFRRDSLEPIPQAKALIERVAALRRTDLDAARAYLEYLAGSPESGEGRDRVLEQLQQCCRSDEQQRSLLLNELVQEVCGFSWATRNLMRLHLANHDDPKRFERAKQEADRLDDEQRSDPQVQFDLGMIHRGLNHWSKAREHFEAAQRAEKSDGRLEGAEDESAHEARVQRAEKFDQQLEALIYLREASLREDEYQLQRAAVSDTEARWRAWQQEVAQLLECGVSGHDVRPRLADDVTESAHRLLWRIDQRLESPRQSLRRLKQFRRERDWPPTLTAQVRDLLRETGQVGMHLDGTARGELSLERDLELRETRWFLARGHIDVVRRGLGAAEDSPSPGHPRPLLEAELAMRTGHYDEASRLLFDADWEKHDLFDQVLELRIALMLNRADRERGDIPHAQRLLESPAARLLPMLVRVTLQSEAAAAVGDWRAAHEPMHRLLTAEPRAPRLLSCYGWLCVCWGQDARAEQCFQRLLEVDPGHVYACVGMQLANGRWPDRESGPLSNGHDPSELLPPLADRLDRAGRLEHARKLVEGWEA